MRFQGTGPLLLLVLLAMSVVSPCLTRAQSPISGNDNKITQYLQDQWTMKDGLPNNSVLDIVQDKRGYLWLATFNGIVRFDGVKFTVYNSDNISGLRGNGILKLYTDEETIYVGTNGGGLLKSQGDSFVAVPGTERQIVTTIIRDREGNLWAGTRKGLLVMREGRMVPCDLPDSRVHLEDANIYDLELSPKGELLAGCSGIGIYILKNESWEKWEYNHLLPSQSVRVMLADHTGKLWVGTDRGLLLMDNEEAVTYDRGSGLPHPYVNDLAEDMDGNIWVATDNGYARISAGKIESQPGQEDGFSRLTSQTIYQDYEGNIWVGSYRQGMVKLKKGKFRNLTPIEGIPKSVVNVTYADGDTVWLGTDKGLAQVITGAADSVINHSLGNGTAVNRIRSILRDSRGRLLVVTSGGLVHFKNGKVVKQYGSKDGLPTNTLRDITEDNEGNLWLGTANGWGRWNEKALWLPDHDGINNPFTLFVEAGKDGSVLAGTNGGGLQIVKDNFLKVISTELPSEVVFEALEDESGAWWICTNAGLALLDGDKIFSYDLAQKAGSGAVFDILGDKLGNLWLMTDRGVIRASRQELLDLATGKKDSLTDTRIYGRADGLAAYETTGAGHGSTDRQGRLWIPTPFGVTIINPADIKMHEYVPPVVVEKVFADGKPLAGDTVTTSPGIQRFEFHYTGLSLYAPDQLKFYYKLEGFDKEWIEAANRRVAYYTNLAPGTYKFRVKTTTHDGIENEDGAAVTLRHKPYFYETTLFYWVLFLLALILVGIIIFWRIRAYKSHNKKLEKEVEDRTETLRHQHFEISRQSEKIKAYYDSLQESISYASRIQDAVLPDENDLANCFSDHFIFYRPKEKVSGDFYWYKMQEDGSCLVAAVDCTGHGVPGALMSILANTLLYEISSNGYDGDPGGMLTDLDRRTRAMLGGGGVKSRDGMDIALLKADEKTLYFSGAKRPLLIVRNGKMEILKGNRSSIGSTLDPELPVYDTLTISREGISWIYLYSDGYADQFKEGGKKFMTGRFRELLDNVHNMPGNLQKEELNRTLESWMGNEEQVDDILVMGLKMN